MDRVIKDFGLGRLPLQGTDYIPFSVDGEITKYAQLSDILAWTDDVRIAAEAAANSTEEMRDEVLELHDDIVEIKAQIDLAVIASAESAEAADESAGLSALGKTGAEEARDLAQNYAAALTGTSLTSLAVGTGSKTLTTQTGKQWQIGTRLRFAEASNAAYMDGEVTGYIGADVTINVDFAQGSGTHANWKIGITGSRGATGMRGGAGTTWNHDSSTTTAADPGTGDIRLNNASLASVTEISISDLCGEVGNADLSGQIALWGGSNTPNNKGTLRLRKRGAPENFADYTVVSLNDQTGYTRLTVAHQGSGGSFTNGDPLDVLFVRTGDKGADGLGAGDMLKATYDPTNVNSSAFDRANHGGTQLAATISDFASAARTAAVADAITDGVTNVAPSQNAVFDALALKLPTSYLDIDGNLAANSDVKIPSQKAVKTFVESMALNLGKRQRVRVKSTGNVTISTALNNGDTLNGVTLATGDLVLLNNQSAAADNGVYVVGVSPARAAEFDTWAEFPGSLITVAEGTVDADTVWLCTSNDGGTLGSTAISFSKTSATGALLAANNLSDLSDANAARTALGLAIGANVQAQNAGLSDIAGLSASNDDIIQRKSGAWANRTLAQVLADLQGTGSSAASAGFRGMPQNSQTVSYNCVLGDSGFEMFHPSGAGAGDTFTIPANASVAYPVGTLLGFSNGDTNNLTVAIASDTLRKQSDGSTGSVTLGQYKSIIARKMTSTEWWWQGTV